MSPRGTWHWARHFFSGALGFSRWMARTSVPVCVGGGASETHEASGESLFTQMDTTDRMPYLLTRPSIETTALSLSSNAASGTPALNAICPMCWMRGRDLSDTTTTTALAVPLSSAFVVSLTPNEICGLNDKGTPYVFPAPVPLSASVNSFMRVSHIFLLTSGGVATQPTMLGLARESLGQGARGMGRCRCPRRRRKERRKHRPCLLAPRHSLRPRAPWTSLCKRPWHSLFISRLTKDL